MDWNKSKNIIILLLLIVNVFLAANLGYSVYVQKSARNEQIASLLEYLAARGISMESGVLPESGLGRVVMLVERDRGLESAAADVLVPGAKSRTDGGFSRYSGSGERSLTVSSGGLLEAKNISPTGNGEPRDASEGDLTALLADAGISSDFVENADGFVSVCGAFDGMKIFNCVVFAQLSQTRWDMSGRWCFGVPLPVNNETEMDAIGLIVKFVNSVTALDIPIRTIDDIEPGYLAGTILNIGIRLIPVYKITTDIGDFFIDAIEGALVQAEE